MGKARKARGLSHAAGGHSARGVAARSVVRRFLKEDAGATAIEYGLICALIFLAIIGGATAFGRQTNETYTVITKAVDKVL